MADTSRLARMRPNRLGGGARRQAIGKQQQRPDPAPPLRSHLRAAGHEAGRGTGEVGGKEFIRAVSEGFS